MSTDVPALFTRLLDDAAVFPPGNAPLPQALKAHRLHRTAWYADLVGPLLLPASRLSEAQALLGEAAGQPDEAPGGEAPGPPGEVPGPAGPGGSAPGGEDAAPLAIGVIGDTGVVGLSAVLESPPAGLSVRQAEVAVAKRGEDPQPGLRDLLARLGDWADVVAYAEIPLTWGLMAALDTLAEARATGLLVAAKFRTGGLAAELFPTPVELAGVICACRDRGLPFKLTAGLHHATRYTDPETGFTHHGFLNVLVATAVAARGAEVAEVADLLGTTDPVPLIEQTRSRLIKKRPLWIGFGTCDIAEPLDDLERLGLLTRGEST